ncbi:putative spermidine/putrescine transport system permease protein [Bradyrhizobium sp. LB14.3]|uniref:ABC transporter permease subunit n=1 Tax=Bradyrhizobium sp. LB14.3 TaxID=3156328 RepID=UPI003391606B
METLQKLSRMPIWLTVPALAILLVVFGVPMVLLFLTSLNAPALSIVNYQSFLIQPANVRVLFQTIEVSVVATAICLLLGYPMAYLIAIASKHLRAVLIVLTFIPWLTSGVVRTYAWTVILGDRGLINSLLLKMGLISSPLELIYNRTAVYIGIVHIMLPVMILPLLSVMMGIDKSLMAAANSMGARPFASFWRVFFPLSLAGVRSGVLLVFVGSLGFYITPAALGGLRDAMLSNFIASQMAASIDLGPVAASAFILLGIAAFALSIFGLNLSTQHGVVVQKERKSWQLSLLAFRSVTVHVNEVAASFKAARWRVQLYQAAGKGNRSKLIGIFFMVAVMIYLQFPGLIVIAMSFSAGAVLEFPPSGFSLQWYRSFFGDPTWTDAFWASLQVAIIVAILSTIVGTLAAFGLSRTSPRVRSFLTLAILMPITFPLIVVGVAIYFGLVKLGLIGTATGLVLAHSVGAMGTVVVIVSANLSNFDRRLEQAAMSMRAGPLQTFSKITIPLIRPGIIGGAVFAFIHSFDEVVVTSLVSGFSIRTLPLKMLENISNQIDPTIAAVGSLLTVLPVLWLIALYFTWWKSRPLARKVHAEPLI